MSNSIDKEKMDLILKETKKDRVNLIAILQRVQNNFGFISMEKLILIANHFNISKNEVYGVASFYKQFKFIKPGKHKIVVCMGTACFVKGATIISDAIESFLNIKAGETTVDGLFSYDQVACLGCCALSPAVQIDGEVYGRMTPAKLMRKIELIRKEEES